MIVRLVLFVLCLSFGFAPAQAQTPVLRVHLLGTGGPELVPDRAGYTTLIEAPGLADHEGLLLFDAGRGSLQRLYEQRINPRRVTRIFLTPICTATISPACPTCG